VLATALASATLSLVAGAAQTGSAAITPPPEARSAPARAALRASPEVWQRAQKPYAENPSNPLANRVWGVYRGSQDQVSGPYRAAKGNRKALLSKIALRPRAKWYGSFVADSSIRSSVRSYIGGSQRGDRSKLAQISVFRMAPWEGEACNRPSSARERRSYLRWIDQLAAGIGAAPMLVVMQPDGPFLWCAPDRAAKARLLTYATKKLSSLPRTSVYIDAGASDWCENGRGASPARCAAILKLTGVRYARGFALNSSHYTGPVANVRHGASIVRILARDGYGRKHFIVDTAKSGRPMRWKDVVPASAHGAKDNARVCRSRSQRRCVTLGIPPTARAGDARWGLPAHERALARRYVDAFVWLGRPWLHMQADPFVMSRALDLARSTPWPGPRAATRH